MPKQEPLPPPPQIDDQLTDSEEMQRVLEEHLLKPDTPAAEPPAVGGVEEGDDLPPSPEANSAEASSGIPKSAKDLKSNDQVVAWFASVVGTSTAAEFIDPDTKEIRWQAFVDDYLLAGDVRDRQAFLANFFDIYPHAAQLFSFCATLCDTEILKPAVNTEVREVKLSIINSLVNRHLKILRQQFGYVGDNQCVAVDKTSSLFEQGLLQTAGLVDEDKFNPEIINERLITYIQKAASLESSKPAVGAAWELVAAIAESIMRKYQPNLVERAEYSKSLGKLARAQTVWLIGQDELAKQGKPNNPYQPLVDIFRNGGVYLGVYEDEVSHEIKPVVLLPKAG